MGEIRSINYDYTCSGNTDIRKLADINLWRKDLMLEKMCEFFDKRLDEYEEHQLIA
ncbi:MAG: hypothetical protein GX625_08380 [Clostridiaceae bacterium]|nr:hypothetical protein [Clostridiaceae bacterium]